MTEPWQWTGAGLQGCTFHLYFLLPGLITAQPPELLLTFSNSLLLLLLLSPSRAPVIRFARQGFTPWPQSQLLPPCRGLCFRGRRPQPHWTSLSTCWLPLQANPGSPPPSLFDSEKSKETAYSEAERDLIQHQRFPNLAAQSTYLGSLTIPNRAKDPNPEILV